jgi:hypothetical protein
MSDTKAQVCPDGGTCHHQCEPSACFRVRNCGPLSVANYPGNRWPDDVQAQHADRKPQRCPRKRPHGPHNYQLETKTPVWGKVATSHRCPGIPA